MRLKSRLSALEFCPRLIILGNLEARWVGEGVGLCRLTAERAADATVPQASSGDLGRVDLDQGLLLRRSRTMLDRCPRCRPFDYSEGDHMFCWCLGGSSPHLHRWAPMVRSARALWCSFRKRQQTPLHRPWFWRPMLGSGAEPHPSRRQPHSRQPPMPLFRQL